MSALGVSQDICPLDGDGVFNFPDGTSFALAVDTKNAAGATAASEAAVAGNSLQDCIIFETDILFYLSMQGRMMRCCCS